MECKHCHKPIRKDVNWYDWIHDNGKYGCAFGKRTVAEPK